MNATITGNRQCDPHNRSRDNLAALALAAGSKKNEANARAWGKLATQSIKVGDYQTAINRLQQGIMDTSYSQYTGHDFKG